MTRSGLRARSARRSSQPAAAAAPAVSSSRRRASPPAPRWEPAAAHAFRMYVTSTVDTHLPLQVAWVSCIQLFLSISSTRDRIPSATAAVISAILCYCAWARHHLPSGSSARTSFFRSCWRSLTRAAYAYAPVVTLQPVRPSIPVFYQTSVVPAPMDSRAHLHALLHPPGNFNVTPAR